MTIRTVTDREELRALVGDDSVVMWTAQGEHDTHGPGSMTWRAWTHDGAVVVAAAELARRDRLAVHGSVGPVADLVRQLFDTGQVAPTFRPFGPAAVIGEVARRVDALEFVASWGWMDLTEPPALREPPTRCSWLNDDHAVNALLDEAFPLSYARPGLPGVRRWAVIDEGLAAAGLPLAIAADAWSAPDVGFLAGLATRSEARGRGHGGRVCAFVLNALVEEHGRAALMVDAHNHAAIELYRRLGMRWRDVASLRVDGISRTSSRHRLPT